jgi:hypothetical protein
VHQAVTAWAQRLAQAQPGVLRVGYFGSYARQDWGVGSDLDLVVVLEAIDKPFGERSLALNATSIPVPVDILVYSQNEWQELSAAQGRFTHTLQSEAVWVYDSREK